MGTVLQLPQVLVPDAKDWKEIIIAMFKINSGVHVYCSVQPGFASRTWERQTDMLSCWLPHVLLVNLGCIL